MTSWPRACGTVVGVRFRAPRTLRPNVSRVQVRRHWEFLRWHTDLVPPSPRTPQRHDRDDRPRLRAAARSGSARTREHRAAAAARRSASLSRDQVASAECHPASLRIFPRRHHGLAPRDGYEKRSVESRCPPRLQSAARRSWSRLPWPQYSSVPFTGALHRRTGVARGIQPLREQRASDWHQRR